MKIITDLIKSPVNFVLACVAYAGGWALASYTVTGHIEIAWADDLGYWQGWAAVALYLFAGSGAYNFLKNVRSWLFPKTTE